MDVIEVGSLVCWKREKRDEPALPVRRNEIFRVARFLGNGRCDLVDRNGAALFNISLTDLQVWIPELSERRPTLRRKPSYRGK